MSTLREKEQRLHQIVAGSAFACALCALPLLQHLFIKDATLAQTSQGAVAGISTDTSITEADVATPAPTFASKAACIQDKDQQLSDLARFVAGERVAIQEQSDAATAPYQAQLNDLKGTPEQVAQETVSLENLIDQAAAPYRKKLSDVESAAASQNVAIASLACPSE